MSFLHSLETYLAELSSKVPVEIFTLFGSFIEEVIAPIPSPLVLTLAGSIAFSQNHTLPFLIWLSLVGTLGKTLGAWLVYFIADKLEDVFMARLGRFFGVSQQDVEGLGRYFSGSWKDTLILFILRALPIMPSAPVSVVCGIIKIDLRTYFIATIFGTFVRNLIYLYVGYAGVSAYASFLNGLQSAESIIQMLILAGIVLLLAWIYSRRKKGVSFEWLKKK